MVFKAMCSNFHGATKRRLDDAIALAERLGKEGKVIEKDDWMNQKEGPRPSGKLEINTIKGTRKQLAPFRFNFYNSITSPSYYTRDMSDKIF